MNKEGLIKEYVKAVTGVDIEVEIIEGTVVLYIQGRFHIYLLYDRIQFIGVLEDSEIEFVSRIAAYRKNILNIYNK